MTQNYAKKIALKVSVVTIIINIALCVFKLIAGLVGKSSAMVSDAVHSASDVASTIIVIIGVIIANKPTDKLHQYGHERLECVASIILSIMLFATGAIIGYNGVINIIEEKYLTFQNPTLFALIAAVISIIVKEFMYQYTIKNAKKIDSVSLKADAWHHRSDAISSVGSLLGIGATMIFNLPLFDVIVSIIICLLILKVAIDIFIEAIDKMVDKSCPEEFIEKIKQTLTLIDGIITVDEIKTRIFGNKIYVDVEIGAYKNLSLEVAHTIAETAHDAIESLDDNIKHCMVHVNPVDVKSLTKESEQSSKEEKFEE